MCSLCDLLMDGEYYEDVVAKLFEDSVIIALKVPLPRYRKQRLRPF